RSREKRRNSFWVESASLCRACSGPVAGRCGAVLFGTVGAKRGEVQCKTSMRRIAFSQTVENGCDDVPGLAWVFPANAVSHSRSIALKMLWIEDSRMRTELSKTMQELRQEFEDNRIQFILTELETATTFCDLALSSKNPEKTRRNTDHASLGYKTALRMANKANLQGEV